MKTENKLSFVQTSMLWMLLSCFLSAIMATITKYVAGSLPPLQMVFFRNLFAVMCLVPWALTAGLPHMRAAKVRLYFSRSLSSLFAMSMFFFALSKVALTSAIALTFTVPIFTTLFAGIFLHEKVSIQKWLALFVGFSGVIIVLRPGHEYFDFAMLFVVAATVFWAISNILIKKLSQSEHPRAMVFIMMVLMTPLTLPGALYDWQQVTKEQLFWLFILGLVTNEAQFCMNKAYKHVAMSTVMPIDFTRLIFTSIFAYGFFSEIIDVWTLFGSIVIFGSALYVVQHEAAIRRKLKN